MENYSEGASDKPETFSQLNFLNEANRVWEELGSKENIKHLVYNPPKLLVQEDVFVKLNNDVKRDCRVYVFDKILLIGAARSDAVRPRPRKTMGESASKPSSGSSTDYIWFGDKKTASSVADSSEIDDSGHKLPMDGAVDVRSHLSSESELTETLAANSEIRAVLEEMDRQDRSMMGKKQFKLKIWIELKKVRVKYAKKGYGDNEELVINISYPTQVQEQIEPGKYIYNNLVDFAQIILPKNQAAKNIMGSLDEALTKIAQDVLQEQMREEMEELAWDVDEDTRRPSEFTNLSSSGRTRSAPGAVKPVSSKKNNSIVGTDKRISNSTTVSSQSGTGSTTSSKKKTRRFAKKKKKLAATAAFYSLPADKREYDENGKPKNSNVLTPEAVKELYKKYDKRQQVRQGDVVEKDEGLDAEFNVTFHAKNMGFSLSSYVPLGPFVCRLIPDGQAELAGVTLGDKVVAVNSTEIKGDMKWQECVEIIKQETKDKSKLRITFVRRQKNEIDRQTREADKVKTLEHNLLVDGTDDVEEVEAPGKVESVITDDEGDIDSLRKKTSMTSMSSDVEVQRKSDVIDPITKKKYPRYTIKKSKKKKKRKFGRKMEVYNQMRNQITTAMELKEFNKNKNKIVKLYENNAELFNVMKDNVVPNVVGIIYAIEELWSTEKGYNEQLNHFRGYYLKLQKAKHQVRCKDLKTGKPFCEHRRPLRMCKQTSRQRIRSVEDRVLEKIFHNMTSIMKLNYVLWTKLQESLGELYEKLMKEQYLDPIELVTSVCKVFEQFTPFLKMYQVYCKSYPDASTNFAEVYKTNKHFRKVVDDHGKVLAAQENKKSGAGLRKQGHNLSGLISAPLQRIQRYHLLFSAIQKELRKYSKFAKDNTDKLPYNEQLFAETQGKIDKAAEQLKGIGFTVELFVGDAVSYQNLVDIYFKMGLNSNKKLDKKLINGLIQPQRKLEQTYTIHMESISEDEIVPECTMYLFNDILVVAEEKSKRSPSLLGFSVGNYSMKKLSYSKTDSSKTGKKVSTASGRSSGSKKLSYSKNLGPKQHVSIQSYRSNNSADKGSVGSSESSYLEPFFCTQLIKMQQIKPIQKQVEEGELFGLQFYYSKKDLENPGEMIVAQVVMWLGDRGERDGLIEKIDGLIEDFNTQDGNWKKLRKHVAKREKRKRFRKKHDRNKKTSEKKKKSGQTSNHAFRPGSIPSKPVNPLDSL
eukprot:snap_masked-scaffold_15-processed-gene-2.40-mRNA-1 protein AED:1.00 eAED:1.00 QI:0/-1/0/0/-1/1/1/0/1203